MAAQMLDLSEEISSQILFTTLKNVLADLSQHQALQLFDGKNLRDTVGIAELILQDCCRDDESYSSDDELDGDVLTMDEVIDDTLMPDNSCGATSNRLCHLLLGQQDAHDEHYKYLDDFSQTVDALEYPCLVRLELSRRNDVDEFVGTHSYTVLAHSADKINVMAAYIGEYNLAEYLLMDKPGGINKEALDEMSLVEYLDRVKVLEVGDPQETAEAYNSLYGDESDDTIYRVQCAALPIDLAFAQQNILALRQCAQACAKEHPEFAQHGYLYCALECIKNNLDANTPNFGALMDYISLKQTQAVHGDVDDVASIAAAI